MRRVLATLALVVGLAGNLAADETIDAAKMWSSWRGPLGTGVAPHADPPLEFNEEKNVRWKVDLPGPGHASPIVWGERIYILSAVKTGKRPESAEPPVDVPQDDNRERRGPARGEKPTTLHRFVVSALDRKTGESVWHTTVREELPHEAGHLTASQASASPVTDGEHLFAFFGSRGLYALDMNGKVVWKIDLGDMRTRNEFGEGSSPALDGETLVVNWDHEDESFIVAFDKATGKERWRVARDEPTSWSSPVFVDDGERRLVVVTGTNRVRAYDIEDGESVWECGGLGLNCVPMPVVEDGLLFVMSGYREAAGLAIRYPGARGDITGSDRVAWKQTRGLSYVPSPILYEGRLYFLERFHGVLSSIDMKTGEVNYAEQRLEGITNTYASPVAAAGRMYLIDRDGSGMTIALGSEFKVLARNRLYDVFDASPAIAGDELYIRGHRHLYCIAAP